MFVTCSIEILVVLIAVLIHADILGACAVASHGVVVHDSAMAPRVGEQPPLILDRVPKPGGPHVIE